MNSTTLRAPANLRPRTPTAARATLNLLARIAHGSLELHLPDGETARFGSGTPASSRMRVLQWSATDCTAWVSTNWAPSTLPNAVTTGSYSELSIRLP